MKFVILLCIAIFIFLSGCASSPEKIAAAYVSPIQYQSYTCEQIAQELNRVGRRLQGVTQIQSGEASGDSATMAIGMVLFWPSLFFLEGDTGREGELARMKGEVEAIETVAITKNCNKALQQLAKDRAQAKENRRLNDQKKEVKSPL